MANVSLYAPIESRDGSLTKGSFLKNAFTEKRGETYYCFRRPGLSVYSTNTSEAGQGITNFFSPDGDEYLIRCAGGYIYTMSASTLTATWLDSGAFLTTCGMKIYLARLVRLQGILFAIGSDLQTATRFRVAYSADDGATWNALVDVADSNASYPNGARWAACVHDNKIFICNGLTGAGTQIRECWYSADGVTWTQASAATGVTSNTSRAGRVVSHGGSLYLFLPGSTSNPVWVSADDGVNWSSAAASAGFNNSGNARLDYGVISDGTYLYVVGGSIAVTNAPREIWRSTDATSWAELGSDVLSSVCSATSGSNQSVEIVRWQGIYWLFMWADSGANDGTIWKSTDLTTWTDAGTPSYNSAGNLYLQTGGVGVDYVVVPTPSGFAVAGFPGDGGFAATDHNVYRLAYSATVGNTNVGAIGGLGIVDFTQNYARTLVAIKSSASLKQLTVPGFTLTTVTDADYPAETVRGIVYLNGVFYVMDPDGTIYGSASEDLTSWSALNTISAEFESDGGVCLAKYNFNIVAFGEYTTELFYDAGNATGSALSPVQNGVLNVGCADADSVAMVDETLIFAARAKGPSQSVTGARFIAQMVGNSYQRISSPDIERILLADDFADVEAVVFSVAGHSYYALNLGTSALTLVYDLSQQTWTVWNRRRTSFTHNPTGVVTTNGTATYTATHSFSDGDVGVVTAFSGTHTALNGTYNMIVPASGTLCWNVGTAYSGTSTGTGTATGWSETDFGIVSACGYEGVQLAQDASNGKLYTIDPDVYQDDSVYMDWRARLGKLDLGTQREKFAAYADFISDRASGNVLMRHSDDDSQTWSKFRPRSLSGQRTRWHRSGNFRRRVYEFRITDNIPVRAERVELDLGDAENG